jgi:short subunit dehydrogenase-like uncharacterized protein
LLAPSVYGLEVILRKPDAGLVRPSMTRRLSIYGATGYTGRLLAESAVRAGLRPILAGRSEAVLATLARSLDLPHRVAPLDDADRLDALLSGIHVVLNAAGPFSATAAPMADACLRAGVHYLDVAAEVPVLAALAERHAAARARGVMVMPAVGFEVVASDCLAAHVADRLRNARRLSIGISGLGLASRGSLRTMVEQAGAVHARRDGQLVRITPGTLRRAFDYGDGPRDSVHVSWGDVVSAYYTTGIPDITVYFESTPALRSMLTASRWFGGALGAAPWQAWLKAHAQLVPEGPTAAERASARAVIVAEAEDDVGRTVRARLTTPEAYGFTAESGIAVARRVLAGDVEPGLQTPARVWGADFVLALPGVQREDLT